MRLLAKSLLPALLLGLCMLPARAQTPPTRIGLSVEAVGVQPLFGLTDRFDPFASFAAGIGLETDPASYWELRLMRHDFPRADQLELTELSDASPAVQDSLHLSLEIIGAGVIYQRRLLTRGVFRPFVMVGGGFYYWTERRGGFEDDNVILTPLERSQWSGGAHGGLGAELFLTPALAVQAAVDYSILFGELWPTLSVGLENVSTFQFASARLGLRYYF